MRTLRGRGLTNSGGWNRRRLVHHTVEEIKFYHHDEAPTNLLCSCGARFEEPTAAKADQTYRCHQKAMRSTLPVSPLTVSIDTMRAPDPPKGEPLAVTAAPRRRVSHVAGPAR